MHRDRALEFFPVEETIRQLVNVAVENNPDELTLAVEYRAPGVAPDNYRVAEFVQATVGYDGRSEGGRRAVHLARAEVRAFF